LNLALIALLESLIDMLIRINKPPVFEFIAGLAEEQLESIHKDEQLNEMTMMMMIFFPLFF
jgi:hypothetical protein